MSYSYVCWFICLFVGSQERLSVRFYKSWHIRFIAGFRVFASALRPPDATGQRVASGGPVLTYPAFTAGRQTEDGGTCSENDHASGRQGK